MLPRMARPMMLDVTEDSTTMPKDSAAHCRRMISIAKNTPASGALKVAAIPPAAPQATSSRTAARRAAQLGQRGAEGRSDLHDRALAPDRPAAADAQRRGQCLDDRDLRADPAAVAGHRDHHFGNAVPAGLPGEPVDQRPVEQPGDDGRQHDEPRAEPRHMRVRDVTEPGVVGEAGRGVR